MTRSGYVGQGKGRLFYLIGLPHAGKSSYANQWVAQPDCRPRVVIAGDDFRHAMTGHEYLPAAEAFVFATMDVAIRALLLRGFDVLVDETSTTEATLRRYLKNDPEAEPLWVETSAEECVRRARANGREYLVGPIHRMAEQLATLRADWVNTWERLKAEAKFRLEHDNHI